MNRNGCDSQTGDKENAAFLRVAFCVILGLHGNPSINGHTAVVVQG